LLLLVALGGCGRLAFDPLGNGDASGDGKTADADNRPPAIGPVQVQYTASNACASCNSLVLQADPGPPDDPGYRRVALVMLASGLSVGGSAPAGTSITYGNVPMNGAMINRHPDPTFKPVLELWQLTDPPEGMVTIAVLLSSATESLEAGVIIVDGVHPTQPIRSFGAGNGNSMMTSSTSNSGTDDVVIDMVCSGFDIVGQDPANSGLINESQGNVSTCGNLEAGRRAGATPSVTSHWMVNSGQTDYWLQLMASLQPP
jgi:hypothetical protein